MKSSFQLEAEERASDQIKALIPDELLTKAFENTNFGSTPYREVVRESLLKCASGYTTGRTAKIICMELGLVTAKWTLTKHGKEYLYESNAALKYAPQWVGVEDRSVPMPKGETDFLLLYADGTIRRYFEEDQPIEIATHWAKFPAPPSENNVKG